MTQAAIARVLMYALAALSILWLIDSRAYWQDRAKAEQAAHSQTVANYRAAATKAKADDAANKARVEAEQRTINERTAREYEARIADARARYSSLLPHAGSVASSTGSSPVSQVSNGTKGTPPAPSQGGLPLGDALTATEQAIQLDELINWVEAQTDVETTNEQH